MPAPRPASRPAPSRSSMGGGGRRDVTEKNEAAIYYSQQNFDQTANDYMMTKMTFGSLAVIVIFAMIVFVFNLGLNFMILAGVLFLFWAGYFFLSVAKKPVLTRIPYKEASNYWTYELTQQYKDRNVALNDFKKIIADNFVDKTTLIDDVSVNLTSYDPLTFEFSVQSSRARAEDVKAKAGKFGSKFGCNDGVVTQIGNISYRVTYPRKGIWETLAGKSISPKDAVGETHTPSLEHNPIGLCTTTLEEVCINNASLHTIITGMSGYGKSNMFNMILYNLYPTDAIILFYDKKGGVEAYPTQERCWAVVNNEQAAAWADAITQEIRYRSQWLADHGGLKKFASPEVAANDSDAAPFSKEFPPIIIAVDECFQWINDSDVKSKKKMNDFVILVAQQGRFAGITLMCAAQQPRSTSIPDAVRANVDQKIAYKQSEEFENLAIDISRSPTDPRPSKIPTKDGHGGGGTGQVCFSASSTDGKPIPVKGYYISSKMITEGAHRYASRKGRDLAVAKRAEENYQKLRAGKPDLPPTL